MSKVYGFESCFVEYGIVVEWFSVADNYHIFAEWFSVEDDLVID